MQLAYVPHPFYFSRKLMLTHDVALERYCSLIIIYVKYSLAPNQLHTYIHSYMIVHIKLTIGSVVSPTINYDWLSHPSVPADTRNPINYILKNLCT